MPRATVLVQDGAVIHAREQRNARLRPDHVLALQDLAAMKGWRIRPDRMIFDHFENSGTSNTEVTLLSRGQDGTMRFESLVLGGSMSGAEAADLSLFLEVTEHPTFEAGLICADLVDLGAVEVVCIKGVDAPATAPLTASSLLSKMRDAGEGYSRDMEP